MAMVWVTRRGGVFLAAAGTVVVGAKISNPEKRDVHCRVDSFREPCPVSFFGSEPQHSASSPANNAPITSTDVE